MWILLLTSILVLLGLLFLVYNNEIRDHFESKGIPYMGNGNVRFITNCFRGIQFVEDMANVYKVMKRKGIKVSGSTDLGQRALIVADTDLLKKIFIKDFDHFSDRRDFAIGKHDALFAKMLFSVRGEQWKELRTKLSPTFTTGKIKRLFRLFDQSGKKYINFLESQMEMSNGEIELTEGFSKYAMDIIASAACGFDSQAFNQMEPSLFEQMGKALQFQLGGLQLIKMILMNILPIKVSESLGFSFFSGEAQAFFTEVVKSSIKQRIENGEKRDDFIQLMMEAREGKLRTEDSELGAFEKDAIIESNGIEAEATKTSQLLDDEGIVSNCVLFILAGFDATQTLLLFLSYGLVLNPDVQEKVRAEVDGVLAKFNGELTYDGLAKMTYLDMVINETLRMWPPATFTDRGCTLEYKIPGSEFILKKGDTVLIPIYGIHHDEQFYPNPEKFDPERFSPENKHKINPYAYFPFGQGPRNCIGMRFALTKAKVMISKLVHDFKIEPSSKTLIPMKFAKSANLKPKGGLYVSLKKLKKNNN